MIAAIALLAALVLAALVAVHLWWAATGKVPAAVIPTQVDGTPLFTPRRAESAGVAAVLALAAWILLQRGGVGAEALPRWGRIAGSVVFAILFGARAVGDGRFVGFSRRVRSSLFARWDAKLYTPIVLTLALASGALAAFGR